MDTILVATDFSKASRNAALYAVEIAKRLNSKIILFNAIWVAPADSEINMSISASKLKTQNYNRLKQESLLIDPEQKLVELICVEGEIADLLIKVASVHNVEFMVVGSKTVCSDFRDIFGSTVNELIGELEIPLLIIPDAVQFSRRSNNLYPAGGSADEKLFFGKMFIARAVKEKGSKSSQHLNAKLKQEFFVLNSYPIHQLQSFNDILEEAEWSDYIKVKMPHKQEWVERFLKSNEPGEMIYRVRFPVLVLPPVKVLRTRLSYEIQKAYLLDSIH